MVLCLRALLNYFNLKIWNSPKKHLSEMITKNPEQIFYTKSLSNRDLLLTSISSLNIRATMIPKYLLNISLWTTPKKISSVIERYGE